MGVNHLWGILAPVKVHKPLKSLEGQTIVVDLSVWICECAQALEGVLIAKPYLRNIFFRISNLIQMGVNLIFVLDGEPPELKWDEMARRNEARFDGSKKGRWGHRRRKKEQTTVGEEVGRKKKKDRKRFNFVVKECQEMLEHLGIPCVQAAGEAEAMCAYLNQQGIADACITQDSDAFLYGARTVYRNFTLNTKDPHIECYSMDEIESQLGLDQHKLIALALLLGCDYVPGVPGIGPKQALRYMEEAQLGSDVLKRLRDQADGPDILTKEAPKKTPHCSKCSHAGAGREHKVYGCSMCETDTACHPKSAQTLECSCPWHTSAETRQKMSLEQQIMRKASAIPGFPSQPAIDEFLIVKDKCPSKKLTWNKPHLISSQKFISAKLEWADDYTVEKIFPLVTLWDLTAIGSYRSFDPTLHVKPVAVVKKRVRQGVACVEIKWQTGIPHSELEHPVTIEREDLFTKAFPDMMTAFEQEKAAKTKQKKKKANTTQKKSTDKSASVNPPGSIVCDIDDLTSAVADISLMSRPNRPSEELEAEASSVAHSASSTNTIKSKAVAHSSSRLKGKASLEAIDLTPNVSHLDQSCEKVSSNDYSYCDETNIEPLPLSERLKLKKRDNSKPFSSTSKGRIKNVQIKKDVEFVCLDDSLSPDASVAEITPYEIPETLRDTPLLPEELQNEKGPKSTSTNKLSSFSTQKELLPTLQSVDASCADCSKNATFGLGFELTNHLFHNDIQASVDENLSLLQFQESEQSPSNEESVFSSVACSPSSTHNFTFGIGFELTKFLSHDDSQELAKTNTSLDQLQDNEPSVNEYFISESQSVMSQQEQQNPYSVDKVDVSPRSKLQSFQHQNVHDRDANTSKRANSYRSEKTWTMGEESVQRSDLITLCTSEIKGQACGSSDDSLQEIFQEDDFAEENRQAFGGFGHRSQEKHPNSGTLNFQKNMRKALLSDSKENPVTEELMIDRLTETIDLNQPGRPYPHRTSNPLNKINLLTQTPINSLCQTFNTPIPVNVDTPIVTDESFFVDGHMEYSTPRISTQDCRPITLLNSNMLSRSKTSTTHSANKHTASLLNRQPVVFEQENSPVSLLDRLKRKHGNQNGVLSAALSMKTFGRVGNKQKKGRKVLMEIFDDDNENDSFL